MEMAIDSLASVAQSFSALDRCDRCPARALVRAQFLSGDLLFCGHHAKELGNVLFIKALSVYDPDGIVSL
jgi:hypothetical protein